MSSLPHPPVGVRHLSGRLQGDGRLSGGRAQSSGESPANCTEHHQTVHGDQMCHILVFCCLTCVCVCFPGVRVFSNSWDSRTLVLLTSRSLEPRTRTGPTLRLRYVRSVVKTHGRRCLWSISCCMQLKSEGWSAAEAVHYCGCFFSSLCCEMNPIVQHVCLCMSINQSLAR